MPLAVGHDRADQGTKNRVRRGGNLTEQWSSLAHIWKRMIESCSSDLAKWHKTKRDKREASRQGFYIPRQKPGISELLGSTPKKVCIAVLST